MVAIPNLFKYFRKNTVSLKVDGSAGQGLVIETSQVDYRKARELYRNSQNNTFLGAGFVAPIINSTVGFMGLPSFKLVEEDEERQGRLNKFIEDNKSKMVETTLEAIKLGDVFVYLTAEESNNVLYPEEPYLKIKYNVIPPEALKKKEIERDINTGEITKYVFETVEKDKAGRDVIVTRTITNDSFETTYTGSGINVPNNETIKNGFGFIPIVHFKNESSSHERFGTSEIEPVYGFINGYHEVLKHAIKGSKMHSTPKIKLKLKDISSFLKHNQGITDINKFIRSGGKLKLDGQEVFLLGPEENAEYVEVKSATGDAQILLKLLFYCIVDTSETPEFMFGVHVPSALASVKEQMPILINKIKRKREQFSDTWKLLIRMYLVMDSYINPGVHLENASTIIDWETIDPRDEKQVAETLKATIEAIVIAKDNELISMETGANYISNFIDDMEKYYSDDPEIMGEHSKILRDRRGRYSQIDEELLEREVKGINENSLFPSKNKDKEDLEE